MSKLRGQYNDRCLGDSLEDLDPLVILAFDHNWKVYFVFFEYGTGKETKKQVRYDDYL